MKKLTFGLVVALLLTALVVPAAMAGPAYSSIQVLNLGAAPADIYIYYYDQDGTLATMDGTNPNPFPDTVAVGESNTYFPVHAADGFNGSVVIESTEEIAVISNINYISPSVQSSWLGFKAGGPVLVFPLIMKGNNSNDTTFNVQNTTDQPVDITIKFVAEPGAGYAAIADVNDTLPAFAAHTYDQRTMSQFAGVTKWVGSAQVSVDGAGAIAGVAQQIDALRNTGTAYNGFLGGVPAVDVPLVMKDNNNMWTSINCQNLGPGATDVTVNFVPEAGYPALTSESKTGVAEFGTAVFIQYGGGQWVGAASVSSTGNDLACIVNQTNLVTFYASAYEGFDALTASDTVVAPLVQFQEQGDLKPLWTSVNVKNLGGTASTVTMDFKPAPGFSDVPNASKSIAAGAVGVFLFYDPNGDGTKAIGGAEISSDNGNTLAVVVNQQKLNYTGDVYSSYNGFAK
jgi:hypothetical protein